MTMAGRICLVTGASSGIGEATARELARMDATVVMACRSESAGGAARRAIAAETGNPDVHLMRVDLSRMDSVRELAAEYTARFGRLHVLVNNAGAIFYNGREESADGFEMTFAVNHLGPFLLTNLLLPALRAGSPSRIVNVASVAHRLGRIDFNDLQSERRYAGRTAYRASKLANVLFTHELARRLEGTGVTANCMNPGVVRTGIYRGARGVERLVTALTFRGARSPAEGARTAVFLASSPAVEGVSGRYFEDQRETPSSRRSHDAGLAARLWLESGRLTGAG
jgi:NAD(P)-dependent dehydrogenase (short-subunit alcohol dehydrogenase family)